MPSGARSWYAPPRMPLVALPIAMGLFLAAPPPGDAPPDTEEYRLVDMMVAQVDTTVITLSELLAEARLVLLRTRGPEIARTAPITEDFLHAVLRSMLNRELLLGEARRLQLREVAEAEVDAGIEELRSRFSSSADYVRFLERIGFGPPRSAAGHTSRGAPPGLVAIVRAELLVTRFINLRIRPAVVVRDSEVLRCYELNRAILGGEPLTAVRPVIEQNLRERRQDAALRELLGQLEKRASLRLAASFDLHGQPMPAEAEPGSLAIRCPLEESKP